MTPDHLKTATAPHYISSSSNPALILQLLSTHGTTMSYLLSYISKMIMCIKIPSTASEAKRLEDGGGGGECCVCLSRIRAGEATRRLQPCRHAFHRDCVDRWLALCKRTCPLCRVHVAPDANRAAVKHAGGDQLADDLVIWFSTMLVPGF